MNILTAQEVASLLSLHVQTVYRKTQRGEIPFLKIGRSIRYRLENVLQIADNGFTSFKNPSLPSFLSHLFWDCEFQKIKADSRIVVERILESGDFAEVQWLLQHVSRKNILSFLKTLGKRRISKKSLNFWNKIWSINDETGNTQQSTEKSLGENGWR